MHSSPPASSSTDPELRGLPLVVGGKPESRGVVATASYEARAFGIGSGMSSAEARRRCPQAVFVPPDHARYRERSQEVWQLVGQLCPRVEQVGIDEGYLDLSAIVGHESARSLLGAIQAAVREATGLGCSLGAGGLEDGREDRQRPAQARRHRRRPRRAATRRSSHRCRSGCCPASDRRRRSGSRAAGCELIGDLAGLDAATLAFTLPGKVGEELQRRARGIDERPVVVEPQEPVTISCEETFERDLVDPERMRGRARAARRARVEPARALRLPRAHRHGQAPLSRLRDRDAGAHARRRGRERGAS